MLKTGIFILAGAVLVLAVYYFLPYTPMRAGIAIDRIVVLKSRHRLLAYASGKLIKTYTVSLGRGGAGAKTQEGDIKIHGLRNDQGYIGKFQRWKDWTSGCIALTNNEIDDLYAHTALGTPIEILP